MVGSCSKSQIHIPICHDVIWFASAIALEFSLWCPNLSRRAVCPSSRPLGPDLHLFSMGCA
ncbi:hypothetical protein FIBSPDRAFT_861622 [Athelia psychrophila]|uniref:Uncharacterized protein n=1 Tax=Athelia psychrophila TaxID=1759441 RepID=A0A166J230_9AGAM|nr:hypothetical protein FIBSPDRAFT_861622 [Fibularhizoctonia sp. CBS 109695]